MNLGNQRGEGRLGFLFSVAIFGVAIFVAVKVVPARMDAYNFRDTIREECRMGAVRKDDTVVFARIMDHAKKNGIPLSKKNLKIKRTKNRLQIVATYEKSIDLKVTTYVYKVKVDEDAPIF